MNDFHCACGDCFLAFTPQRVWWQGKHHTANGCGPELLYEGATCRGAAGRWEAWCLKWPYAPWRIPYADEPNEFPWAKVGAAHLDLHGDEDLELTFTEAES